LAEFLESFSWFKGLPIDLKVLVRETTAERDAGAGEYLARAGEPSTHWFGLIRGILQMYVVGSDGAETTLYCMREGEWGGDGSLLKNEMRGYDLRSLRPAHVCMMPVKTFNTLRNSSIEFNQFLCEILNTRMGVFVGFLVASRLRTPEISVGRAILMLSDGEKADAQELYVSQQELALISGLSRQRVNVAIGELSARGLVQSEARKGFLRVQVPQLRWYVIEDH
jgi:CRP/FNR family transcriptional regulator, cyclic AMP receptor protein